MSTISAAQCRAARALLDWPRESLASESGVALRTIVDFERGARAPRDATLASLARCLEAAGVEFTNGGQPGVRMKAAVPATGDEAALPDIPDEAEPYDGSPV
jgi:transcriptional regulator with XRE-family HTH domain